MKKDYIKRIGGWQVWVEVYKDYVIKTPKSKKEIKETIKRYLDAIGKPEELKERTQKMIEDINNSTKIIKKSKIPFKILGNLEFLDKGKIKQKRAIVLQNKLDSLVKKDKIKEAKKLIDKSINFLIELWKYGIHEKTFKIESNLGIIDNKIVLLDLFELTNKKEKVKKQLKKKNWDKSRSWIDKIPEKLHLYTIKQIKKKLTIKNLNKYWRSK